ncbi:MAG: alkaline phosphatase family protein [Lentisphaerae bacterium]|nr:alkaline phosphatase family protein [Lentisphaerota bacterium]
MREEHDGKKLLIVAAAGLGYDFLRRSQGGTAAGLRFRPAAGVFPALTCPAQATFRTASGPDRHGMVANGLWDRAYARARFWEQSATLVAGPRIWDGFRRSGRRVAMLFWQQSLGEAADIVLSPAPIHKHHGGMIQDCYCRPPGLYARLCAAVGRRFDLMRYWGPCASWRSSQWIAEATAALLADPENAPDLCLTYLPALDYDLQRFGTRHPRSLRALRHLLRQIELLRRAADARGYALLVFGDYAMADVNGGPVLPNLALRREGLLNVRRVRGMSYLDPHTSAAFVVADHEIGHVYVREAAAAPRVRSALAALPGIEAVLDRAAQAERGAAHANSGELVLVAAAGSWIAYPWWDKPREAPDYAAHVDIHNKPGYDPAELFWGWPPGSVSRDPRRVRGTHGRNDSGREIAWAFDLLEREAGSLRDLAGCARDWLGND